MNVSALYRHYEDHLGGREIEMKNMVGACLLHIIGYYFVRWSKSFILIISVEREDSSAFYNDVLDRTFANWKQYSLQIVNVHRGQKRRVRGTRDYNMVLVDSYQSFV